MPTPSAVPAPPREKSGFAVASLILGLLWICGIGSILAIIFGAIGLKETRPPEGKDGRGLAIAGLILGIMGLLATVGMAVLLVAAGGQLSENLGTPTEIDDVTITACTSDPATGVGLAEVTIVNDSAKTSDYLITVQFTDGAGDQFVGPRSVERVRPDERITIEVRSGDPIVPFLCELEFVDRFASDQ